MTDASILTLLHRNAAPALPEWRESMAVRMAADERLDLTPDHWEVIYLLRAMQMEQGRLPSARKLLNYLSEQFAHEGGRRYLYTLFPEGPVAQGCRLAGVPAPSDTFSNAFGTRH